MAAVTSKLVMTAVVAPAAVLEAAWVEMAAVVATDAVLEVVV